jgi:hypothetical protein
MALSKGNGTLLHYDQENQANAAADVGLIFTCLQPAPNLQPD